MTAYQVDTILSKLASGDRLNPQDMISMLTPELLERMLKRWGDDGQKSGSATKETEVICRLLASGMPECEIAIVLCAKSNVISDAAKYNKEAIAKYTKQLKGRRQKAKQATV